MRNFRFAVLSLAIALGQSSLAMAVGIFTSAPLINDATSGISSTKTYHALANIGETNSATVNGVVFPGFNGGATITGTNFTLVGANNDRPDDADAVPSGTTGSIADLLNEFVFGIADVDANTQTPSVSRLTLSNLMVGGAYQTTFYNAPFGNIGGRVTNISTSDGGTIVFDENFTGPATGTRTGNVLRYDFVATAPTLTIDFAPVVIADTFHHYAFSNELVAVPEPATLVLLGLGASGLVVAARRRKR